MIDKYLLFPYYLTLKIRNLLYDKEIRKSVSAEVPTICVGNVTVGGTGKTPHTEMLLRMLLASEKWGGANIAVLSRGYRRESRGFQQVTMEGSAAAYGDEPMQIKKKFPQITVAVDKNRVEGCKYLCHPDILQGKKRAFRKIADKIFPAADLIILDDAFQYRRLKASLNIVLVDYNRPVHNDMLMPLGRLRDLKERVSDADLVIVTKCPQELSDWEKTCWAETLGIRDFHASTSEGTAPNGKKQTVLFSYISYKTPEGIFPESDPRYIYSKRLVLFTGIARDTHLRKHLSDSYKIVRRMRFSDHHKYSWSDFQRIRRASASWPTAAIATTEKDAQRVVDCKGIPVSLKERMIQVPIEVKMVSEHETELLREILAKLS